MNYYETLYIVHSALESGRLKDIVLTVENSLKESGGSILATEIWGKKKLGYLIDKQKYGTYILMQFKSDGTKNNNFNTEMEHNPSILAYMTIRIEKDNIKEQSESLDDQIAGKEAKSSQQAPVTSNEEKSTNTNIEKKAIEDDTKPTEVIDQEENPEEKDENNKMETTVETPNTEKSETSTEEKVEE